KPNASTAPDSTNGSAWIALTAERGKTGLSTSPSSSTVLPSASTTITAPRWRLSTTAPRVTSTRTGFVISHQILQFAAASRDAGKASIEPDDPGGGEAAIDGQGLAGDVAGFRRKQEGDG